jgi:hypothetical protein
VMPPSPPPPAPSSCQVSVAWSPSSVPSGGTAYISWNSQSAVLPNPVGNVTYPVHLSCDGAYAGEYNVAANGPLSPDTGARYPTMTTSCTASCVGQDGVTRYSPKATVTVY